VAQRKTKMRTNWEKRELRDPIEKKTMGAGTGNFQTHWKKKHIQKEPRLKSKRRKKKKRLTEEDTRKGKKPGKRVSLRWWIKKKSCGELIFGAK